MDCDTDLISLGRHLAAFGPYSLALPFLAEARRFGFAASGGAMTVSSFEEAAALAAEASFASCLAPCSSRVASAAERSSTPPSDNQAQAPLLPIGLRCQAKPGEMTLERFVRLAVLKADQEIWCHRLADGNRRLRLFSLDLPGSNKTLQSHVHRGDHGR